MFDKKKTFGAITGLNERGRIGEGRGVGGAQGREGKGCCCFLVQSIGIQCSVNCVLAFLIKAQIDIMYSECSRPGRNKIANVVTK